MKEDTRLAREAAFHDDCFSSDSRAEAGKYYEVGIRSHQEYRKLLLQGVSGRHVLEYGCGTGSSAFVIASNGGTVLGIDISPVAIEQARKQASARQLAGQLEFRVMDAENLDAPDASFDVVCGMGILHHLNLSKAFPEIHRVLKPGGRGIFIEPLGHNPFINWYRSRTPHLRTEDEHPLLQTDLAQARGLFPGLRLRYFHLVTLGTVPFRSTKAFRPLLGVAESIDRVLVAPWSPFRSWAWQVLIEMGR